MRQVNERAHRGAEGETWDGRLTRERHGLRLH